MSVPPWHEEPVSKGHDRTGFDCGNKHLNEFLKCHARKSHDLGGAKTFLAVNDADDMTIFGFYSLAPASLAYQRTPDVIKRGLARHDVPVFRLARLAVDRSLQGRGLGGQLLLAAGRRCLRASTQVGGVALLIDAKHQQAAQWYAGYGAHPLPDQPLRLLLPFKTIHAALAASDKL